jgi:cytochrome c oxidase assembly protein subunit 15
MDNPSAANSSATPYNHAHHRFAVVLTCCTFFLIMAGALVTSNDAGLSVPDWPTSFGSMYRIPPMTGGVQFEHGHRMIAQAIGFLTIILAVWTQRVDRRPWMRVLGWAALGTVIAQGILGGLTVLLHLPPAVSTAHATLAQTFFCLVVSMTLFTSKAWLDEVPERLSDEGRPPLTTISLIAVACVWLQLILGAAFRHSGMRLLPHLIGAFVVVCVVHWAAIKAIKRYRHVPAVKRTATALLMLVGLQVVLGIGAYVTRVILSPESSERLTSMVAATVAHVAGGALVLATSVALAIQIHRHTACEIESPASEGRPATA